MKKKAIKILKSYIKNTAGCTEYFYFLHENYYGKIEISFRCFLRMIVIESISCKDGLPAYQLPVGSFQWCLK